MLLIHLCFAVLLSSNPDNQAEASQASAPPSLCDPNLRQVFQDPQGYRLRGDHCEGVYIEPVSSSSLLVASFTSFFQNFDSNSLEALSVDWSTRAKAPVRLRAYGLREKLYYQMDTVVVPNKTTYLWSKSVLNSLHLSKPDIGMVAFTDFRIGSETRTLYLPLSVGTAPHKSAPGYQAVLVPGSELKEVFISLARVDADGRPHSFSISDRPLRRGYYPAERGILIDVPDPGPPGIYYLEIGAATKYGGTLTQQVWFYHGAR